MPELLYPTVLQLARAPPAYSAEGIYRDVTKTHTQVFIDTFDILAHVYDEKDDGTAMTSPAQVALQLADWSNPEKLLLSEPDESVHLDLAADVLKHLCTITTSAF